MHEQLISVIEPSPSHIWTPLLLWSLRPTSTHGRPTSTSSFTCYQSELLMLGFGAAVASFVEFDVLCLFASAAIVLCF
ncbi:hypothetical protein QL285_064053 [Trifolium repens]|nr:hypothetical protein QL285_064053 [Trifolium repens]